MHNKFDLNPLSARAFHVMQGWVNVGHMGCDAQVQHLPIKGHLFVLNSLCLYLVIFLIQIIIEEIRHVELDKQESIILTDWLLLIQWFSYFPTA